MESVTSLISELKERIDVRNRTITKLEAREFQLVDQISRQNKEIAGYISIQNDLKQTIRNEIENRQRLEREIGETNKRVINAEFATETVQRRLDESETSRRLAEARAGDLERSLAIERQRFDDALAYERSAELGLRQRFGLAPRPESEVKQPTPQPVSSRPAPWGRQQAELEAKAQQAANDAKDAHWRSRIAEVEARDAGQSGDTAETGSTPAEA